MSMTEQELSDEISAVIEARMSVPWQDAEPAAKALATMVKQYIERHIAAGQQGAMSAWVGDMKTSAGMDYYVCVGHGKDCGEHMTPNVHKIRGRAEYDVACWNHLFGLCEAPDILAFDTDEPTATPRQPNPAGAVPLIPLSKEDAAAVLRQFNRWRLGDDALEQPDSTIALALIIAIEALAEAAGRADAVSMAQRFLRWGLPVTFAPDAGISFDRSYCEKWATWPTGTNLFTADEAADMMRFVLETSPAGAPPAQQPLDDSANNAGVATGSRNESPSESVTRGSPQVTTSPASAPSR